MLLSFCFLILLPGELTERLVFTKFVAFFMQQDNLTASHALYQHKANACCSFLDKTVVPYVVTTVPLLICATVYQDISGAG